jgi:hypothetical protein
MTSNQHDLPDASAPTISVMHRNFFTDAPASWDDFLRSAEIIDEAGIDRVVMSDHVVMGDDLEVYAKPEAGGIAGGRQPTGPDGVWLDPLATLAVIAGRTRRVRLATGILLASALGSAGNARNTRRPDSTITRVAGCSTTHWGSSPPCGGTPRRASPMTGSTSRASTSCPSRRKPAGCRSG